MKRDIKRKRIMNARPLFIIAVFFALGVVLGRYLDWRWAFLIAAAALAAAATCLYRQKVFLLVCGATLCFAAFLSVTAFAVDYTDTGDELAVSGRVVAQTYQSSSGSTILLLDNAMIGDEPCGDIKLYVKDVEASYKPGDVVVATADVALPKGVRNPGGFDEKMYLLSQGVHYKAFADTALVTGHKGGIAVAFANARISIGETIARIYDEDVAAVAVAMMLGDKHGLDADTYTAFQDTGAAHVLAVSGLHAGILIGAVYLLLKALRVGRTPRLIITLAFIAAYALLTGLTPSIVRASIMAAALLLGQYFGRQTDTLSHLSLAFLLSLIINPLDLFTAGFQLSFGAVFGILTIGWQISYWLKRKLPEGWGRVADAVGISVGATAGVLPLLAMTFNRISVFSVFTNILVVPIASVAIVVVFISVITGLIALPLAVPFAFIASSFMRLMLIILKGFAGMPFNAVDIASPPVLIVLVWLVVMFAVSKFLCVKTKRKAIFSSAVVCISVLALLIAAQPHGMYVAFLDVGQADAAFIKTEQGGQYFIDGGREQSAGEVVDFAIRNGYLPDAAFVSHSDSDHFSGIVALYDAGLLQKVYCSWQELETVSAAMPDAQVLPLCAGDKVLLDAHTQALVLYPYRDTSAEKCNENSLVLLIKYGTHSVLFTGDISGAVETQIFADVGEVDIYKAAHHGSKFSSYQLPLSRLSPQCSVVSVGYNNYGHPHAWAMHNLEMYSDALYVTDKDYAVVFHIDDEITVRTYGE